MPDYSLLRPIPKGVRYQLRQGFGEHPEFYATVWPGLHGHNGLDYAAKLGSPVVAAHSGIATLGDEGETGYGLYVKIVCGYMSTIYAHLSARTVKDGQAVVAGQEIAAIGSSGLSSGSHLHFGWRVVGVANPAYLHYLDPVFGRKMSGG